MIKISELPEANSIGDSDQLILDQVDGVTRKVLISTIKTDIATLIEDRIANAEATILGEYSDFQVLDTMPFSKEMMRYYNPEDPILKDCNYIIADGTYLDGTVYKKIYQHLLAVYDDPTIRPEISVKDKDIDEYTDYDYVLNRLGRYFRIPLKYNKEYRLFKSNVETLENMNVARDINQEYTMPANGVLIFSASNVPNQPNEADNRGGPGGRDEYTECQQSRGIQILDENSKILAIDDRALTYNSSQPRITYYCSAEVYKGQTIYLRHMFNNLPTFNVSLIRNVSNDILRIFIGGYKE